MSLSGELNKVQSTIQEAKNRAGLSHHVEIVAVTKSHPASSILAAHEGGITHIGENKVQEAENKFNAPNIENLAIIRRMIGRLQSNKAKKAANLFDCIDSIHSISLAQKISNAAQANSKHINALIQVNTSGEEAKSGFLLSQTEEILKCCELENLTIDGFMTMAPLGGTEEETRRSFKSLRNLRENLGAQLSSATLKELSMGMSGDYHIAVEEGSTMVRLGTALFGARATT